MTRTLNRWTTVWIDNSGGALTQLSSINTIGGLSLDGQAVDMSAWVDTLKGVLIDTPTFSTTIGGVFDTVDHALLIAINNRNTPLSFDVRVGLQAAYSAGVDPQFGVTSSASNGVLLHGYTVNFDNMTWTATLENYAGGAGPAWGTASET